MGWINDLYETYENCSSCIGEGDDLHTMLLPIAHSTQNAQIEICINNKGDYLRASKIDKNYQTTIIPVTEDSASRSSGIEPHPLLDKLVYVAGDYTQYVEKKKGDEYHEKYLELIGRWCSSIYQDPKVKAVYEYIKKGSMIQDLVSDGVLEIDEKGKLKKNVKIGDIAQADAFVRFRVEIPGDTVPEIWLDKKVYQSYIEFYESIHDDKKVCYITGQVVPCCQKHPTKIRNTGDKAKLISANDNENFTFRGRFFAKDQVVQVSYDVSQKAHNALRWLIAKQGYRNEGESIVVWETNNKKLPDWNGDTDDLEDDLEEDEEVKPSTNEEYAYRLNKAIAGYGKDIDTKAKVRIIAVDSATTGRLSVTYYKSLDIEQFLERIRYWHNTCIWRHTYKKKEAGTDAKGKTQYKNIVFIGAPAPIDIVYAAYGSNISKNLKKATIDRLLNCIIDKARLPEDIVRSTAERASSPVSMDKWEWEKTLSIACALIKKYRLEKFKEEWQMGLDENQMDRSYLFGRMLAVAQKIEEWAIGSNGDSRQTNAERYMHQFKLHPYKTWGIINDNLNPYIARLGGKATGYVNLIAKISSMISYEDFTSQKALDDSYLLGYYCQRQVFIDERIKKAEERAANIVASK